MPATKAVKTTKKPVKRVPVQTAKQAVTELRRASKERSGIRYAGAYKSLNSIPGWRMGEGESDLGSLYSKSPWAKRCVDLRSNALASVDWGIFDNDDEEIEEHSLINLLSEVDGETNWDDLIRMTVADKLIYGSAYWMKVYGRSASGDIEGSVPIRIRRLNPSTMGVEAGPDGISGFVQTLNGVPTKFKRNEIVYFHDYDPLNDLGAVSCADVARTAIESESNADRYISSFFANRAAPDIIFETEQELSDADFARMRRTLKKDYKGVDKMHKTMVTEKGMKAHVISFPIGDLALEAVRLEARRSICAAFQVPMSIAGADASANYATADAERKSLYTETVMPDGEYIAGVINAELCNDYGYEAHFEWKFDDLPIMQPDAVSEAQRLALLVEKGIIRAEVAAIALGFTPEDVPERVEPSVGDFTPRLTPEALAPADTQPIGRAEIEEAPQKSADLKRWMKKSIARVKAGKSAAVDFESEVIPKTLKAAILGQLEGCETADEVRHVFNSDMSEEGGMNVREVIALAKAMKPEAIHIHADNMTANTEPAIAAAVKSAMQSVPPSTVTVNVPEQETTVNVAPPAVEVNVAAPSVTVEAAKETFKAAPAAPKLRSRTEVQKVKRDASGNIVQTEADVDYHYEGEE